MQAWAEHKCYYQEIFTGDLEKELGTSTRLYTGNTQIWQKWFIWQTGQDRNFDIFLCKGKSQNSNLTVFFPPLM